MRYITTFSMLWLNYNLLLAQEQSDGIVQGLDMAGFENVRIFEKGNSLTISYGNNLYRNKSKALSEVLDQLSNCGFDTVKVVTLINDMPVIVTQLRPDVWEQYSSGQITASEAMGHINIAYKTDAAWKTLRNIIPHNPHINKVALVFYPQFLLMNIRLDQIYEVQFNIAPALEVSLWRGMKFTGQVIFPVVSDRWYGSEGKLTRAGFIALAQEFHVPGTIFGRAVVGKFNAGRYGADMSLTRYFFNGQSYLKANAGYTGEYQYYEGDWLRNEIKTLTWSLKGGYFWQPHNIQLDMSAGRYFNGDYLLRGDCTRYWGEKAVGFYAMVGGKKFNGGFHFAIPIGPKQHKKNRNVQLRAPDYFDWEYNVRSEITGGQYYKTQPNENRVEHFFNPNLVIKNLVK